MMFSIGDKVVHPYHGPGRITNLEEKDMPNGAKEYYVIDIPIRDLTVYVPLKRMDELGVRMAMPRTKVTGVLKTLQSKPNLLPKDYKERQEEVWEKLKTGRPTLIAETVRDLSWRKARAHLTKRDSELLKRGQDLLAAEMALVSGIEVSEATEQIEAVLETAMANMAN